MISNTDLTAYVLDSDPAWRDELAILLGREGIRFQLFSTLDQLLSALGSDCGGCVLAEWAPLDHGINLATELRRRLHHRGIDIPCVFFSAAPDYVSTRLAFRAGALDFLAKTAPQEDIRATLTEAFASERKRLAARRRLVQRESLLNQLTPREREVAILAARGHDNPGIARQLEISHRTVEVHKGRLMKKLGARSLADLMRLGGLLPHKG